MTGKGDGMVKIKISSSESGTIQAIEDVRFFNIENQILIKMKK